MYSSYWKPNDGRESTVRTDHEALHRDEATHKAMQSDETELRPLDLETIMSSKAAVKFWYLHRPKTMAYVHRNATKIQSLGRAFAVRQLRARHGAEFMAELARQDQARRDADELKELSDDERAAKEVDDAAYDARVEASRRLRREQMEQERQAEAAVRLAQAAAASARRAEAEQRVAEEAEERRVAAQRDEEQRAEAARREAKEAEERRVAALAEEEQRVAEEQRVREEAERREAEDAARDEERRRVEEEERRVEQEEAERRREEEERRADEELRRKEEEAAALVALQAREEEERLEREAEEVRVREEQERVQRERKEEEVRVREEQERVQREREEEDARVRELEERAQREREEQERRVAEAAFAAQRAKDEEERIRQERIQQEKTEKYEQSMSKDVPVLVRRRDPGRIVSYDKQRETYAVKMDSSVGGMEITVPSSDVQLDDGRILSPRTKVDTPFGAGEVVGLDPHVGCYAINTEVNASDGDQFLAFVQIKDVAVYVEEEEERAIVEDASLPLPDEIGLVSARIVDSRIVNRTGTRFIQYKLEIRTTNYGTLFCWKRYSTFRLLCDRLMKENGMKRRDIPDLPHRHLVGNFSQKTIGERAEKLNLFLNAAVTAEHLQWGIRVDDQIAVYKRRNKRATQPSSKPTGRTSRSIFSRRR
ncbi:unnamed protein product [Hyaloperonospora brassicae]|uniref:PX domain-containing protein n=1 Tax=Hyaloperonospora brassicae TaxID=162125 RepID=A0AAV0U5D0_HYABA|nr:unnamed protein product [Hyaloperonospora brassicae]